MLRKIARPMLASVFVLDGVDTVRNASEHVPETESALKWIRKVVPSDYRGLVPSDPETVAKGLGGAKVGAGSLLALGKAPRLSASVLAVASLPSLLGRNAFWDAKDDAEKEDRRNGFLTSIALLGGLFLVTQDTEGKPSLRWRAQDAGKRTSKKVQAALPGKSETQKFADEASDWFDDATDKVKDYIDDNKDDWQEAGQNVLNTAKSYAQDAKGFIDDNKGDWLEQAQKSAKTAKKSVVKNASKAQKKADKALSDVDTKKGKRAVKKAGKKAEKLQDKADKKLAKAIDKVGNLIND